MPYTNSSNFVLQFPHRTIAATGDITGSQFTIILDGFAAEVNRFLDVTSDFCSYSSNSQESDLLRKLANDFIEEACTFIEQGKNVRVQDRVNLKPPSIYDAKYRSQLEPLRKEKKEEHFTAINYNLRTGTVSKY